MKTITRGEREALNQIRISNRSGSHVGCIRIFRNNTKQHEIAKALLAIELIFQNKMVMTEAIFNEGKRGDVVNLTDGEVWEVLETETIKNFQKKIDSYPVYFLVYPVKAKDIIEKGAKEVLI